MAARSINLETPCTLSRYTQCVRVYTYYVRGGLWCNLNLTSVACRASPPHPARLSRGVARLVVCLSNGAPATDYHYTQPSARIIVCSHPLTLSSSPSLSLSLLISSAPGFPATAGRPTDRRGVALLIHPSPRRRAAGPSRPFNYIQYTYIVYDARNTLFPRGGL